MKKALFYLLDSATLPDHEALLSYEALACQIAAEQWRNGKRVLIACDTQHQAEQLDEALWQRNPNQFVPHNLAGEGPHYGAPVELCWPEKRSNAARDVLINLQMEFPSFATSFKEVIDFVPFDEERKALARERYKHYRHIGFHLQTAPPPVATMRT